MPQIVGAQWRMHVQHDVMMSLTHHVLGLRPLLPTAFSPPALCCRRGDWGRASTSPVSPPLGPSAAVAVLLEVWPGFRGQVSGHGRHRWRPWPCCHGGSGGEVGVRACIFWRRSPLPPQHCWGSFPCLQILRGPGHPLPHRDAAYVAHHNSEHSVVKTPDSSVV